MAVIALSDTRVWHGSAAILSLIAARLDASGEFPRFRQQFLHIVDRWQALDARDMNALEIIKFKDIVTALISEVSANGPTEHGGDVPHSGLLARLTELEALLQPET